VGLLVALGLPFGMYGTHLVVAGHGVGWPVLAAAALLFAWAAYEWPRPSWVRVSNDGVEFMRDGRLGRTQWSQVQAVRPHQLSLPDGTVLARAIQVTLNDGTELSVAEEWPFADAVAGSLMLKRFEPTARYGFGAEALMYARLPSGNESTSDTPHVLPDSN